jgi:hypothetical protein
MFVPFLRIEGHQAHRRDLFFAGKSNQKRDHAFAKMWRPGVDRVIHVGIRYCHVLQWGPRVLGQEARQLIGDGAA